MKVTVGVVQESPVFFDKEATLKKLTSISEASALKGCELLVFPESFVPGYPRGFNFGTTVGNRTQEGRNLFLDYRQQCIDLQSSDLHFLENVSKEHDIYLILGITEKDSRHGSLFCSMIYISPTHGLLGVHRKIKATGAERQIWSEAAGESLVTFQTKLGKLGGLICWENYMPEARMAIYQKGVEIYLAPTADARETWIHSMRHIALEGRCFVLGCNQFFNRSMYDEKHRNLLPEKPEIICRGGSVIVSPLGEIIAGPLFDKSGVLVASLDLEDIVRAKLDFDVIGHYSRPDIFKFRAKDQPDIIKE